MSYTDEWGTWKTIPRAACQVRLLEQPSQQFLNWQASIIEPIDLDALRVEELLATSPQAITMPDIWELLRLFGKLHGFPQD